MPFCVIIKPVLTSRMDNSSDFKFRRKTSDQLEQQLQRVSGNLNAEILPSQMEEDILKIDVEEIREKYGARYQAYLKTLRETASGQSADAFEHGRRSNFIKALNNLDDYIRKDKSHGELATLRGTQINVFQDLRDFLEDGGTEGYIKLPTGTGKTVIFSEFIEATALKTLIVVPTKILVGQTEQKLEEFTEDIDVGKIYSEAKQHGHQVTITTYDSFTKGVENGTIKPEDFQMLILDEAHRALSQKRSDALKKFDNHIKIGFTATPRYSDDKHVVNILNTEIHNMSIREAVEEAMLCTFSVIVAETETDISNVKIAGGEYSEAELTQAINKESRNKAAVSLYQSQFAGETAVAYCCGVSHATALAEEFNSAGVSAAVVFGNQSPTEQKEIMRKYAIGEILVLCNADLLIEGFDEPRASVCFNLRPTLSPVVAEQRGGRVLRLDKNRPGKFAKIVEFIDRNSNAKNSPVTFVQIAESARIDYMARVGLSANPLVEASLAQSLVVSGLNVIVDPKEVMRIVKLMEGGKYQLAPAGWSTVHGLAKKLGKDFVSIHRMAKKYKENNPQWYKLYLDEKKELYEHLAPELVDMIIKRFTAYEKAPAGWMTTNILAITLQKSFGLVREVAEKFRQDHPEWFHIYIGKKGKVVEHFSPELCLEVMAELAKYDEAPDGWFTAAALAEKVGRTGITVSKEAEAYRAEHPEWFKKYLNKRGRLFEYFAPELVAIMETRFTEYERAPEGWVTMNFLVEKLGYSYGVVQQQVEKYREEHPEWLRIYLTAENSKIEHVSPELVAQLEKDAKEAPTKGEIKGVFGLTKAPEGWINGTQAAKTLGMGHRKFLLVAQKYRGERPELFGQFRPERGPGIEYYSPELIQALRSERSSMKDAPEGWSNSAKLSEVLKVTSVRVVNFVETYRMEHLDWFAKYSRKGHSVEHYSPELVKIVTDHFISEAAAKLAKGAGSESMESTTFEEAPPGWKTLNMLRVEFKKSGEKIAEAVNKYRAEYGDWFKLYKSKTVVAEHFSPELVEILALELQEIKRAPEGWLICSVVASKLKKAQKTVSNEADKYRSEHPEWFVAYQGKDLHFREHFSLELVAKIEETLSQTTTAPAGWLTAEGLSGKVSATAPTIQKTAEKYRADHPDWFKDYLNHRGRKFEYYAPELVKLLEVEFMKYDEVPAGWLSNNQLVAELGQGFYVVKKRAEKYRAEHPEWFAMYKPKKGSISEYYSPELVAKLRGEFSG